MFDAVIFILAVTAGALLIKPITWLWEPPEFECELRNGLMFLAFGGLLVAIVVVALSAIGEHHG